MTSEEKDLLFRIRFVAKGILIATSNQGKRLNDIDRKLINDRAKVIDALIEKLIQEEV